MWRGPLRGVVLLGILVWSHVALAQDYNYLNFRMLHTSENPFRYYVDSKSAPPTGILLSQVDTAVQNAFQTWDSVACASTAFSYAGQSGTTVADVRNAYDRFNVAAVWITSKQDPYYTSSLGNGSLPLVAVPLHYGGYLYQCDILINGTGDFKWSTASTTQAGYMDLQTYLLQAVGFCQGLDVTYDTLMKDAVMSNSLPVGSSRRALTQYDRDLLCRRYPAASEPSIVSSPCSSTNTCTNALSCATPQNTGNVVDYRFCTQGCRNISPGECPDPFVCKPSTAVPGYQYACLPAAKDFFTRVGNACADPAGDCGSAYGFCQQPVQLPSTGTAWYKGYCSQTCTSGGNECPSGSACASVGASRQCLKSCGTSRDCREGYVCASRPEGNLCIPRCYADADCGSGFSCRLCEGVCAPQRSSGALIGDACNDSAQCGTGQTCLKVNGHPQGFCSQTCGGTSTCSCPEGSTCQAVGPNGSTMCVRTCSANTCASGLHCAPFPGSTTGCMPLCRTQADCPAGATCGGNGQCVAGGNLPDGGSCALCGGPDAGTVTPNPNPGPSDGGTNPGGGGTAGPGCGCQGSAVNAPGFLGALAVFLVAARRRRCQRP